MNAFKIIHDFKLCQRMTYSYNAAVIVVTHSNN